MFLAVGGVVEFRVTQNKLAVAIGVPPRRINEIVHGKRGITADTAIRLARYFGTSEEFWMNLQTNDELRLGAPVAPRSGRCDHTAFGGMSLVTPT